MHEPALRCLVQADGERGEDRCAVVRPIGCRALRRHARGSDCIATRWPGSSASCADAAREAFQRGEAVLGGKLADRIHPGVEVERREARTARRGSRQCAAPTSVLTLRERIGGHESASC